MEPSNLKLVEFMDALLASDYCRMRRGGNIAALGEDAIWRLC
jgi:hypothetical protein